MRNNITNGFYEKLQLMSGDFSQSNVFRFTMIYGFSRVGCVRLISRENSNNNSRTKKKKKKSN